MQNQLNKKVYLIPNLLFNFKSNKKNKKLNVELEFTDHIEELRQRSLHLLFIFIILCLFAFLEIKPIVELLKIPVHNIRFFQLAPGEYFIETVKISIYSAIIFIIPLCFNQITFFIIPGLTLKEKKLILPLIFSSIVLLFLSLNFSYFFLIPAALQFFISYSSQVIEPLLSFSQYCDFILILFTTTGVAFQIPIFQIILGILNIISGRVMLNIWKYIVLFAVIISAVLTPSTDPITQLVLSIAILILYFIGALILIILKK